MTTKPSAEERIWAVMAHLSALAMGIGIPFPIVGWSQNRRKSNYVSFHSLQALGYQTLVYTIWILVALVAVVVQILDTLAKLIVAAESGADLDSLTRMVTGGHFPLMFLLVGVYYALPVIAAIACAFGMDFRYPIMGKRLAQYLDYAPSRFNAERSRLIEEHEDRWVASMGHFAVIIVIWGLLAPIVSWAIEGKRSLFLRFQSIQTVVYQIGTMLLYFMAGFLYVFGLIVFVVTIGFQGEVALDSASGLIGAIIFLVSLLIAMLIILVVPLLHILGQWAGYRVLKGDEYYYPIIGRLVEKRMRKPTSTLKEK